jgi:hypothetical protein
MAKIKSVSLSDVNTHQNHYKIYSLQETNLETAQQNIDSFL